MSVAPGPPGRRFVLHHAPHARAPRGLVVYVHPFAEEMNKSRRMAALQSRALAAEGFAVLQLDLLGCGDSSGEFGDATWARWVDDVVAACRWLQRSHAPPVGHAAPPLWLWGLRVGCLLAAEAAEMLGGNCDFLFWQPIVAGTIALQQFLRLKLVADLVVGNAKGTTAGLRDRLASGQAVEIAGYSLNPALSAGLERAVLRPTARPCRVEWMEVATGADRQLSPASARTIEQWQGAGCQVRTRVMTGPAFWQTAEIEEVPELLAVTAATLSKGRGPARAAEDLAPARDATVPLGESTGLERALTFACAGETLIGTLSMPSAPEHAPGSAAGRRSVATGIVIVVGGPQYRAGSHRQFTLLARSAAAAGFSVLRFDYRGMGDSTGARRDFQEVNDDIAAAIGALLQERPTLERVVLWGLCDGASAALLYLHARRDPRVQGLCLLNPWVRTESGLARAHVRHYYPQRLRQPGFWRKAFTGQVAGLAAREFWRNVVKSFERSVHARSGNGARTDRSAAFHERMAEAAAEFDGDLLLVISGKDLTAREFLENVREATAWQRALAKQTCARLDFADADHTFSASRELRELQTAMVQWLDNLDRRRELKGIQ